jgi:hypothetical protein
VHIKQGLSLPRQLKEHFLLLRPLLTPPYTVPLPPRHQMVLLLSSNQEIAPTSGFKGPLDDDADEGQGCQMYVFVSLKFLVYVRFFALGYQEKIV